MWKKHWTWNELNHIIRVSHCTFLNCIPTWQAKCRTGTYLLCNISNPFLQQWQASFNILSVRECTTFTPKKKTDETRTKKCFNPEKKAFSESQLVSHYSGCASMFICIILKRHFLKCQNGQVLTQRIWFLQWQKDPFLNPELQKNCLKINKRDFIIH